MYLCSKYSDKYHLKYCSMNRGVADVVMTDAILQIGVNSKRGLKLGFFFLLLKRV